MRWPESCYHCQLLQKALKDPNVGRKLKYMWSDEWTGGCQSFWANIRKTDPDRELTKMGCIYFSRPCWIDQLMLIERSKVRM